MAKVELRGVNLSHANLGFAQLPGAQLSYTYLDKSNLHAVNLKGANLNWAYLSSTNLKEAWLKEANLRVHFKTLAQGVMALGEADAILSDYHPLFGPRVGLAQHLKWRF
jgi:uncharacterized protein YjbI with pentapeptide repeats